MIQNWEYLVRSATTKDVEVFICRYGKEGWELVNVVGETASPMVICFFKRPLTSTLNG